MIQRLSEGDESVLLVRLGDTSSFATTLYVKEAAWQVGRMDGMTHLPGMGMIGQEIEFSDFRDVSGMLLPYRVEMVLANPMIGKIVGTVTALTTGIDVGEGFFRLE